MITAIIVLVLLGLGLYLIETYIPMSQPIKLVIRVVVVIFSILYILRIFGIADVPIR